ncbi:nucleotidyl transferase AbiEii/AbiGii toxin family protein [Dysgonomonas sp. 521]|uniref:nucleotidyl transferase AbiEii/AbiGii toxin family protein n=1 Tax=Dysgonomonas sp. 521 TaxID=2302932 RepID=UPI0013D56316|nr:nucleotidyl transferase AbiEii/AbiGii toxin family protein [Dysgonomonas sp. 521]NDV96215.1 nucleotidyl transferase AbiEii/AbiGii toxin family protein [Dysgonomonas sp. 521]
MDQSNNEKGKMNWYKLSYNEKQEVLSVVAVKVGLPAFVVEKDWWVVQTLRLIMQMDIADQIVFKGGTSLSKAWGLINRFSEDIDLAINREFFGYSGDISRTQVGKLKDASNKYLCNDFLNGLRKMFREAGFEDVKLDVVDIKDPDDDPVKIAIVFPVITQYSSYIQPRVLLEIGSRSLMEPSTACKFRSMIGDSFSERSFADENIEINCVNPERTFLEKLFLLHEEHQRPKEKMSIQGKSRHLYDIYKISQTPFAEKAIKDKELYRSIVAHRERFTKLGGVDYMSHYPPCLNPIPPDDLLLLWQNDFKNLTNNMIMDNDVSFEDVMNVIKQISNSINYGN